MCELISYVLGEHEVASAHSIADALRRATARKFDLYVLDYHLPDGTGLELCLLLRAFDRDASGKLIYDSGDRIEQITAAAFPSFFNAGNTNNAFDDRSDNKGPEPEGLTTGKVFGRTYAFIGLERVGGLLVYDLTEPSQPRFVQYVNNRNFVIAPEAGTIAGTVGDLGPEGLHFIEEDDSPNGKPLLVVANEVSGTTTVYEISKAN